MSIDRADRIIEYLLMVIVVLVVVIFGIFMIPTKVFTGDVVVHSRMAESCR